jgi:hypothetical protein
MIRTVLILGGLYGKGYKRQNRYGETLGRDLLYGALVVLKFC